MHLQFDCLTAADKDALHQRVLHVLEQVGIGLGSAVALDLLAEAGASVDRAVREHDAQVVGMSALLTTTLPRMADTIAALREAGLREQAHVLVGGAPVAASWAEEIGADGYGANAGMAVERARELVGSWQAS